MKEKKKRKGDWKRTNSLSLSLSKTLSIQFSSFMVVGWIFVWTSSPPEYGRDFFFLLLIFIRLHTLPFFFFSPITFLFFCSLSIYYTFTSHTHTFLRVKKN
jgi:hypothetical protein